MVRKMVTPSDDEFLDRLPHAAPAARIESGSRLVEEDDPRIADQGHGQVKALFHAAGVRVDRLLRGVDEIEPFEELVHSRAAGLLAEVRRSAINCRFSSPVKSASTAEN